MAKQPPRLSSNELPATSSSASGQSWPKVIAAPAVWESGVLAARRSRLASPYRPRRLTVDPIQRATLW